MFFNIIASLLSTCKHLLFPPAPERSTLSHLCAHITVTVKILRLNDFIFSYVYIQEACVK